MSDDGKCGLQKFSKLCKSIHSADKVTAVLEALTTGSCDLLSADGVTAWVVDDTERSICHLVKRGTVAENLLQAEYYELLEQIQSGLNGPECAGASSHNSHQEQKSEILGFGLITVQEFAITEVHRGILAIYYVPSHSLTDAELALLESVAEQAGVALEKKLGDDGEIAGNMRQMVEGFTLVLEAKDEMTHGHSLRVAKFSRMVAREMELSKQEKETIYHGGLLHDIGKIGLDDVILERLGILSKKERDIIQHHQTIGVRILKPLTFMRDVLPIVLHHHERYDGTGIPDGLSGEKIPLGARIVTVCDALETMIAGRKHLRRLPLADAIVNLQNGKGSKFDTDVVNALLRVIQRYPEMFTQNRRSPSALRIYRDDQRWSHEKVPSIFI